MRRSLRIGSCPALQIALAIPAQPTATRPVITYEYPLNERIRTLLRLEDLFERSRHFIARSDPHDHHMALLTLFEILEVASRADLKSDLLQELERQKQVLCRSATTRRSREEALDDVLRDIEQRRRRAVLDDRQDRPVPARERVADVDQAAHRHPRRRLRVRPALLPLLAAPAGRRAHRPACRLDRARSIRCATARPSSCASCARAAGRSRSTPPQGMFQQMLGGKTAQMLRLRARPDELPCVPEISANKYVLNIRFLAHERRRAALAAHRGRATSRSSSRSAICEAACPVPRCGGCRRSRRRTSGGLSAASAAG